MCEHVNQIEKDSQSIPDISVVVLTYNEEIHIHRCLENVAPWVRDVFVVDCVSTDRTVAIAGELGAKVVQNPWPGTQAEQFNWALDNLLVKSKWVLRLDADEYLYPELIEEIQTKLDGLPEDVTGVVFKRRHIFLGKWMKRGTYPVKLLRLFKYGKARCEQRLMDEHIELLEGRSVEFKGDFADHNLNDIGWWTAKHNGYALREAVDLLDLEYGILGGSNAAGAAGSKGFKRGWRRWFKRGIWKAGGGEAGEEDAVCEDAAVLAGLCLFCDAVCCARGLSGG
jgi:glycosyltransferase involved in cell wall biosynthesis